MAYVASWGMVSPARTVGRDRALALGRQEWTSSRPFENAGGSRTVTPSSFVAAAMMRPVSSEMFLLGL